MTALTTHPLELPTFDSDEEISRVDLVFYGVDHSGPSYTAHVFLGRSSATPRTPRDVAHGYAGSFTVFGHGGCFGDDGHCLPDGRTVDAFDRRPPHPITPLTTTVIVTEALVPLLTDPAATSVTVDVVIDTPGAGRRRKADLPGPFSLVRLLTYVA